jgi:hypothetical protein
MSSMALGRSSREERNVRAGGRRESSSRLGWIGLALGLISLDLEALVFLATLYPIVGWFSQLQIQYNPALVTTFAMLTLGGPPALVGLMCAGARRLSGWRRAPAVVGIAACSLALAIPISYAAFAVMYLRGLI